MAAEGLLVSLAKVGAVVAVVVPLVVWLAQDSLIFYRQPLPDSRRGEIARRYPAVEEVKVAAEDGTQLHGWLVRPEAPGPLVIYFGGNAEEVSWMLDAVGDPARGATPGIGWLLVNYRGYGLSEGSPSEAALVADAVTLYDFAAARPSVDAQRIVAFGRSLGSGVAVPLAAKRPVRAVVLVAPYDSVAALAKRYYPFLPVDLILKHRFDSLALAPQLRQPLLAFIAERDEVIPPVHSERLFDAWGGAKRKVALAGAGHNDTDGADGFWHTLNGFLQEQRR
jgi:fermentation-respiration switch protein FrsA (DUF1100 family)